MCENNLSICALTQKLKSWVLMRNSKIAEQLNLTWSEGYYFLKACHTANLQSFNICLLLKFLISKIVLSFELSAFRSKFISSMPIPKCQNNEYLGCSICRVRHFNQFAWFKTFILFMKLPRIYHQTKCSFAYALPKIFLWSS